MDDRATVFVRVEPRGNRGVWTNSYCTNCLRTRRFLDRPTHVVCETCNKRLEKVGRVHRSAG